MYSISWVFYLGSKNLCNGKYVTTDGQNDSHLRCIDRNSSMIIKLYIWIILPTI